MSEGRGWEHRPAALERQEGCGAFEIVVNDDGSSEAEVVAAVVAESLVRAKGSERGPLAVRLAQVATAAGFATEALARRRD